VLITHSLGRAAGSPELAGWEPGTAKFMVLRYFRWKKSDWKEGRRDGESNKAFPLTPPSPRGEGEPANASSSFGECRLRSHAPKLGTTAVRPSPTRPNALAHSAFPDEPSGSPSPFGRGRGEGGRD
jgi:hypothetical protein